MLSDVHQLENLRRAWRKSRIKGGLADFCEKLG